MAYHEVQVDDEVFAFLKIRAEPFIDTPNTVLRRLLLDAAPAPERAGPPPPAMEQVRRTTPPRGLLPAVPLGTPQALRQILEVTHLVRRRGRSRSDATREVARSHSVAPQTVLDKYCRQLDLTAFKFDRLLEEPDLQQLRSLLVAKFPEHRDGIADVLDGV